MTTRRLFFAGSLLLLVSTDATPFRSRLHNNAPEDEISNWNYFFFPTSTALPVHDPAPEPSVKAHPTMAYTPPPGYQSSLAPTHNPRDYDQEPKATIHDTPTYPDLVPTYPAPTNPTTEFPTPAQASPQGNRAPEPIYSPPPKAIYNSRDGYQPAQDPTFVPPTTPTHPAPVPDDPVPTYPDPLPTYPAPAYPAHTYPVPSETYPQILPTPHTIHYPLPTVAYNTPPIYQSYPVPTFITPTIPTYAAPVPNNPATTHSYPTPMYQAPSYSSPSYSIPNQNHSPLPLPYYPPTPVASTNKPTLASPQPSPQPTRTPTSSAPSAGPSVQPSEMPSVSPSTTFPSSVPSEMPSAISSASPSSLPSLIPSVAPSSFPSTYPSVTPSADPSTEPSTGPTVEESSVPSAEPSVEPSASPSVEPSISPTTSEEPSESPTVSEEPSESPTISGEPSETPTESPEPTLSMSPSIATTISFAPSSAPTSSPQPTFSDQPSMSPTQSRAPSGSPSISPEPSLGLSSAPSGVPTETPGPTTLLGVGVKTPPFAIDYSPFVNRFTPSTFPQLEEVTKEFLNFYLGLVFATPSMSNVNFLKTVVRQTSFNTDRRMNSTRVAFEVTARFEPTPEQPMIPDSNMITRLVKEAFTFMDHPDWVSLYIVRLESLPPENLFRNSETILYVDSNSR